MGNVGAIYVGRALTGTRALSLYAIILSVWAIGRMAWVAKVFANFAMVERAGTGAAAKFVVYALEHAHLGVQLALLVAAVAFAALVADVLRSLGAPQRNYSF